MSNAAPALLQSELVLGRYRPLRPLGSGGSGSVWLARDEQNGLDVALKIVPREGKAASRAEREAEAAARLRHPACQRAYGFGRDSQHVYIAYEYVPGRTFREAMRSGELDDDSAIEASIQILDGLAHAHGRGIVHRDVKPSNVLLADGTRRLRARARLRPRADPRSGDADGRGRRARDARLHLARTARRRGDDRGCGHLGRRRDAVGGPRRAATVLAQSSLLETARAIGAGPAAAGVDARPTWAPVATAVGRALDLDLSRRPDGRDARPALCGWPGGNDDGKGSRQDARRCRRPLRDSCPWRSSAVFTLWTAWGDPRHDGMACSGWPHSRSGAAYIHPRLGLAFALAVPILPLGNFALGAAMLYAAVAICLLVVCWRDSEHGLLFTLGPLLAPISALGLLPLAGLAVRAPVRRAILVGAGVPRGRRRSRPSAGAAALRRLGTAGSRSSGERGSGRRRCGSLGRPGRPPGSPGRDPCPCRCRCPPASGPCSWALGGRLARQRLPRSRFTGGPGGRRSSSRGCCLGDLCCGFCPLASSAGDFPADGLTRNGTKDRGPF